MPASEAFTFGPFRLLGRQRQLLCRDVPVALGSRAFDLLLALVKRQGRLATKDELMAEVWLGTLVEENNLQVQISALRKVLEGDAETRYLLTVPGRGYRFVVPVSRETTKAELAEPASTRMQLPDKPSIAVLPFTNMSGDAEQEYFADGIVEDITTALSRFPSLFVIARNSSFTYKGRAVDMRQVGHELGVRYILEGSVRKVGGRVRITGQLVQAEAGTHVWAENYDRDFGDIFALQDEMTASIVGALVPSLQRAEMERARIKPTESLDAYEWYLRGMAALNSWTKGGNDQALQFLEQALALDPNFGAAVILAEHCWERRYVQGWSPMAEALAESARLARLAVQLDPDNAEALAVLARRMPSINQDYAEAISLAEQAVAINPNSAFAWGQSGWGLVYAGRSESALMHFERALRLSPRDTRAYYCLSGMALALIQLDRDADAVATARKAIQHNPNYAGAWRMLTAGLALAGHLDEARIALRRLLELDPTCSLETIYIRFGHTETARTRYFEGLRKVGMPE